MGLADDVRSLTLAAHEKDALWEKFLTPKSLRLHVVEKSAIVLGGKVKTLYIKELAQDSTFDSHQMEIERVVVTCDVANIKDATFQATGDVIFRGK